MKKYYLFLILFFYYFSAPAQNKLFNLTGVQAAFNFGSDFVDDFNLSFNDIQKITPDHVSLERNFGFDPSLRNHGRFGISREVYAINANLIFKPYNFNKKDYFNNFYFRFGLNYLTNRGSLSYYTNSYFLNQIKKNQSTTLELFNNELNLEGFFFINFAPELN